jgi:hypothetical protein
MYLLDTDYMSLNERLRRKRTEYHFALLARFAARLRSTAPSEAVFDGRSKLRGISPLSGFNEVAPTERSNHGTSN